MLTITHAATLAAYNAATNQAAQIAALLAPWSDGADDVIVRIYDGATLRDTITVGPWTEQASPLPRRIVCGARLARTNSSTGSYTRMVFATATDEIMELTAGVGTGDVQGYGPITAGSAPNVEGVYVTANDALPPVAPLTMQEVLADAMWTWFTDPRAVFRDRRYWYGLITADGRPAVNVYDPNTDTEDEFRLVTGTFETDDHDNAAVMVTPSGKLWAAYSKHNGDNIVRSRLQTTADDNSAWDTEVATDVGALVAYSNIHYLSTPGRYYLHYREGLQSQHALYSTDLTSFSDDGEWIVNSTERPYVKSCNNGTNRIDLFFTAGHPNQVDGNSVYHCYAIFAGDGTKAFYKSDGTYISTGSVTPAQATLVWDGSTGAGEAWGWQIAYGADGHPRVLFAAFPTPASDHRYMHGRWTGSAWEVDEITDAGAPMYAAETYYTKGICFDGNDTTKVCLVRDVSGVGEVQEWRTSDDGATWSKYRDITTGTSSGITWGRPFSCAGHDGVIQFAVWRGNPYTTYSSWTASLWAVGEA